MDNNNNNNNLAGEESAMDATINVVTNDVVVTPSNSAITGNLLTELAPVPLVSLVSPGTPIPCGSLRPRRLCANYSPQPLAGTTGSSTSSLVIDPTNFVTSPVVSIVNSSFNSIDLTNSMDSPNQLFSQNLVRHLLIIEDDILVIVYHGPNKPILCLCSKTFAGLTKFRDHVKACDGIDLPLTRRRIVGFKCHFCEDSKPSMNLISKHYQHCHAELRTSSSPSTVPTTATSSDVSRFDCSFCLEVFPSKIGLGQHKRHRHSDLLYTESASPKVPQYTEPEVHMIAECEADARRSMGIEDMETPRNSKALNEATYANYLARQPDFTRTLSAITGKRTRGDTVHYIELVRKRIRLSSGQTQDSAGPSLEANEQAGAGSQADPIDGPCNCLAETDSAITAHIQRIAVDRSAISAFLTAVRAGLDSYDASTLMGTISSTQARRPTQPTASASDSSFRQQRGKAAKEKESKRVNAMRIFETQGHKRCLQHLQNPTKAGKCSRETVELFKGVFENSGTIDEAPYTVKATRYDPHLVHKTIVPSEVEAQLSRLPRDTAPGVDGMRPADLAAIDSSDLTCLFNIFLVHRDVPKALKINRTTLIPKSAEPSAGDWRPITVSSVIDRLFAKVLEARLSRVVDLDATQRGFIKGLDGCGENITAYGGLIRYARAKSKSLVIVSLDLAKAFDSVKYSSIQRALARMGLNKASIELLMNLCHGQITELQYDEGSVNVELKKGVRQGWPLSPLLFLIVVDELLCSLVESNGFKVVNTASEVAWITGAAFADDLILYSSSELGMKRSIDSTVAWCDARSMKINAKKSSATWLRSIAKGKKVVVNPIRLSVNDDLIPNVGDSFERVLGVHIHNSGRVDLKVDKLRADLKLVRESKLRPSQKLSMISKCLIPMIKYRLTHGFATNQACKQIDRLIRVALRKVLHLPKYTSNYAFYVGKAEGGLGVPRLSDSVVLSQFLLIDRMMKSQNAITRALVDQSQIEKASQHFARFLDGNYLTEESVEGIKKQLREERILKFSNMAQGSGWTMFNAAPRLFLDNPKQRKWTEHDMIEALKLRLDLLPTRMMAKRTYHKNDNILTVCRGCHNDRETIGHIIGRCPITQADRVARHNHLCNYIQKRLQDFANSRTNTSASSFEVHQEYEVTLEARTETQRSTNQRLRPDLAVILDDRIVLIEVSVVFETIYGHESSLEKMRREKCRKYGVLLQALRRRTGKRCSINTLIVGCRGGWLKSNNDLFKGLGLELTKLDQNSLVERAVRGSLIVFSRFCGRTSERIEPIQDARQ